MSRLDYVKYDTAAVAAQAQFKDAFEAVISLVQSHPAGGSEQAQFALVRLEEAYMWVGKMIRDDQVVRNGSATPQEERTDG